MAGGKAYRWLARRRLKRAKIQRAALDSGRRRQPRWHVANAATIGRYGCHVATVAARHVV